MWTKPEELRTPERSTACSAVSTAISTRPLVTTGMACSALRPGRRSGRRVGRQGPTDLCSSTPMDLRYSASAYMGVGSYRCLRPAWEIGVPRLETLPDAVMNTSSESAPLCMLRLELPKQSGSELGHMRPTTVLGWLASNFVVHQGLRMCQVLTLLLQISGCRVHPKQNPQGPADAPVQSTTPTVNRVDSTKAASVDRLVQPEALSEGLPENCDTALATTRQALRIDVKREDGNFRDSFRGIPHVGCRLSAEGAFATLPDSAGPVAAIEAAFQRHGWRSDLRYEADGPDGSDVGVRRRDLLCVIQGRWEGGDDEDTTQPSTETDNGYQAIVECFRDVPSNKDAGVPDSIWHIASAAGLDSVYAISLRLQYPPYLDGDFDGDGVSDAAVLIEHRASGKMGVAIVRRGSGRVSIVGAGISGDGPHDLSWMDQWDVFHRGVSMVLGNPYRPTTHLIADALWIGRRDSAGGFFEWNGREYSWEAGRR